MPDDDSDWIRCITPSELAGGVRTSQQTAYFTLPNGVRCLYLEDNSEEMATVAVTIGVGYFDNPGNIQGLAALVEKMIVLGSTRYPTAGDLEETCVAQGGEFELKTEGETTTITATAPMGALREIFDRIADMICEPLLPHSAVANQISVIDSQHEDTLCNLDNAIKQLIRDMAHSSHPLHGFATGNKLTLGSIPNIVDAVTEWIFRYYVAQNVTVCVSIPDSNALQPEELEALLVETFARLRQGVACQREISQTPSFPEQLLKTWVKVIPPPETNSQTGILKLIFPISIGFMSYRSQALTYVSHFLGANASGSMLSKLIESGKATSGKATCDFQGSSWSIFSITINLTEQGRSLLDDVVVKILQGIYVIKAHALDTTVWGSVSKLVVRHLALSETAVYAGDVSKRMLYAKPEHLLIAGRVFVEYVAADITSVIESLSPANMIGIHIGNHTQRDCPLQSAWGYSLRYNALRMPDSLIMMWCDKIFPLDSNMKLPLVPRIEWIPTPSELHKSTTCTYEGRTTIGTYPSPPTTVYSESVLNSREGLLSISLLFPICMVSPLHAAALLLFSVILDHKMTEFIKEADFHRLTVSIEVPKTSQCRLQITLHGSGSTMSSFVKDTLNEILIILKEWCYSTQLVSPEVFLKCRTESATQVMMQSNRNPVIQARRFAASLLEPEAMHSISALVQGLSELSLEDLIFLYPTVLLTPAAVTATLSGSFSRNQETALSRFILEDFVLSLRKHIPPNCLLAHGGSSMVGCISNLSGTSTKSDNTAVRLTPTMFDSFLVVDSQNTEEDESQPQPCGVTIELCFLPTSWHDITLCVATSVLSCIIHNELQKWTHNIDPSIESGCSYEAFSSVCIY